MKKRLYHGSQFIIQKSEYGKGARHNDYGKGFYCTEQIELAKEWACAKQIDGYVNIYDLDFNGLNVLNLNDGHYNILNWLALLADNRTYWQNGSIAEEAKSYIKENFLPDISAYDVIIGYRADDSYTQVIEAFLLNQINLYEVEKLFYKGSLGNQIFLKSEKAFKEIHWQNAYQVALSEEDKKSDLYARREVSKFLSERMRAILLNGYEVPGITARYAVSHLLKYNTESGEYENAGV